MQHLNFNLQTHSLSHRTNGVPLFFAAKENSAGCIKKLLDCASTNIFERGALGETALHVAVMNDNMEAALALMDGAPELINEPMTSDLFLGMTPLHIAVVNQNFNLVRSLIGKGADVATPRVTGLYFRKRRGGLLYYGEHILAFAACVGNQDIISMVINAGASTRAQDSIGNTVLHILVLQPNKTIACLVLDLLLARDIELDQAVPLDMVPNYHGLTPFKLAAKEGNLVAFQHLVNRRRINQWNLGPLTSNLYDLTEIDSLVADDDCSVLELIVGSKRREAKRILEVTPVRQLVSLKWNLYGKHYFSLYNLCNNLCFLPSIAYAFLVVLLCVFRVSGVQGETVVMAVCLVLGWSNVMFFARGFQMLGPYVIMIQKIIFGDLTKFMWLSFIVLIGFSTPLWVVYMTQDPDSLPAYRSFPITLFSQFELSVGLIDLPVDHTITTPPIVHVLHCTFSVVSYVLLLNLLTAMMSDTQWRVAQERDELWRTQVVATTLMLERRLPRCLWPRLGVCGLLYGLGERWYLRKEREEMENTDMSKGPGSPLIRPKHRGGIDGYRKSLARWQMIRHSALGLDVEQEEPEDDQEVR
uniref:Transient receptor potential cation channel, subfamily V, member 6 n=1 Tax=Oncorhynchus mykiss TaxID=8022 RepID=A0A8C7W0A0_ONCMY